MANKSLESATDKIGQELRVGSVIVAPYTGTTTKIGRVTKISPKMVNFGDVNGKSTSTWNKYHNEVVCLDDLEAAVMYLMTRNL